MSVGDTDAGAATQEKNVSEVLNQKIKQLLKDKMLEDPARLYVAQPPRLLGSEEDLPAMKKLKLEECLPDFQPPCPTTSELPGPSTVTPIQFVFTVWFGFGLPISPYISFSPSLSLS